MEKGITEPRSDTIAKLYFTVQGIGTLISWNGILTGLDYFSGRYKNYDSNFLLPLGFNAAQVMANFFIPKLGIALTLKTRILISLIIISCILVFLPVEANLMSETSAGFYVIMGLIFVLGFFNCVYQATISGFASKFPGKFTSYFLMGGGLAGLTMNGLRAIAILSFSNVRGGDLIEILVYFGVAGVFLIICMIIHPLFTKSYFCRYYLGQTGPHINDTEDQTTQGTGSEPLLETEQQVGKKQGFKTILSVFGEVKLYVLLLILGYTQSFLVFPGVMLEKPMDKMEGNWKVVSMLATFNFCDALGKNLAQYRNKYSKNTIIWIIIARTSLVAFFIIQAITSSIAVFNTMWFAYINIALFGLTSGFLTSALFILGPESVHEGWKKEIAGFLSVFGLTTGLTLGGLFALFLTNLNAHNP